MGYYEEHAPGCQDRTLSKMRYNPDGRGNEPTRDQLAYAYKKSTIGKPGFVVDKAHDKRKYHLNLVDNFIIDNYQVHPELMSNDQRINARLINFDSDLELYALNHQETIRAGKAISEGEYAKSTFPNLTNSEIVEKLEVEGVMNENLLMALTYIKDGIDSTTIDNEEIRTQAIKIRKSIVGFNVESEKHFYNVPGAFVFLPNYLSK